MFILFLSFVTNVAFASSVLSDEQLTKDFCQNPEKVICDGSYLQEENQGFALLKQSKNIEASLREHENKILAPQTEPLKAELIEIVKSFPTLSNQEKTDFVQRLKSAKHILWQEKHPEWKNFCQKDSLAKNAMYDPNENQFQVCPARYIGSFQNSDPLARLAPLTVYTHELAHFISNKETDAKAYDKYMQCLENKHLDLLFPPSPSDKKINESARDIELKVFFRAVETIPDLWASYVLAKKIKQISSARDKVQVFRNNLGSLCRRVDATHATGSYRLNAVFGSSPAIRDAFGCTDSDRYMPQEMLCFF